MPFEQNIEERGSDKGTTILCRYLCSGTCLGYLRSESEENFPERFLLEPERIALEKVRGKKTCDYCGELFRD